MLDSARLVSKLLQRMMDVTDCGRIQYMRMPDGWTEGQASPGGVGFSSRRTFTAIETPETKICISYAGLPVSQQSAASFRQLLRQQPAVLYHNTQPVPSPAEVNLMKELSEILGTAGNNQVVNRDTGWRGPCFQLNRAEVLLWKGKKVLSIQGWYQDPEENKPLTEFFGLFFDADPDASTCSVGEIYLEAPDARSYARCLPAFHKALESIRWK